MSHLILAATLVLGAQISVAGGLWLRPPSFNSATHERSWRAEANDRRRDVRSVPHRPVLLGDFPEYRPGARQAGLESFRR